MPSNKRLDLAIRLTKLALPIWEKYADENKLTYRDTVVGMHHSVDRNLLKETVGFVEQDFHLKKEERIFFKLKAQFDDPIVALQDMDWELPDEIQNIFYSIYNLLEAYCGKSYTSFGDLTIYVSINQAIDALETSGRLTVDELRGIIYINSDG